jgi:heme A synthase
VIIVGLQMFMGIANVLLLTPLEIQVLHLALADGLWITYVCFSAALLGEPVPAERPERSPV